MRASQKAINLLLGTSVRFINSKKSNFYDALTKFKKLKETGVNKFHDGPGRPSFLCDLSKSKLISTLIEKKKKQDFQKSTSFGSVIREHIEKSLGWTGKVIRCFNSIAIQ